MKINISYTLYTDGDYTLRNAEEFGCTERGVKINNDEYYDYVGSVKFTNEEKWRCKSEAKSFLWKLLCDGLSVSYTHPWLIKDFYTIIEDLTKAIDSYETGLSVYTRSLSGNYEGTNFRVKITE